MHKAYSSLFGTFRTYNKFTLIKVVKQHEKELNSRDIDLEAVESSLSSLISRKPVNLQIPYNQK